MDKLASRSAEPDVLDRLAKAEEELAALRRELDHSHQLATLGTLTAGIAHEINNILTPVLAYAQLARSNPHDAGLRAKALDRAVAGVESASRITEAVLGFARTDDEAERADVAEVVESSLACLGRDPTRDGINVVLQVEKGLEVRIRPLGLQQVLLNLVLNAIRALNGKGGELRITARDQNGTTTIVVADTGPGIPPSIADTIFKPFVSSRDTKGCKRSNEHGGSGLGLAVCRRLIERSGGSIILDRSDEASQQGARFQISLVTCSPEPDEPKKAA